MSDRISVEMQIMQDNLCDLRKIAGWTAEVLAGKLGITKQTISNLENQKVRISRIQYIAIRSVFECELAIKPSNTRLNSCKELYAAERRCDRKGHAVFLLSRLVSEMAGAEMAGISTSSRKLK